MLNGIRSVEQLYKDLGVTRQIITASIEEARKRRDRCPCGIPSIGSAWCIDCEREIQRQAKRIAA
jgi:hypothetical protein